MLVAALALEEQEDVFRHLAAVSQVAALRDALPHVVRLLDALFQGGFLQGGDGILLRDDQEGRGDLLVRSVLLLVGVVLAREARPVHVVDLQEQEGGGQMGHDLLQVGHLVARLGDLLVVLLPEERDEDHAPLRVDGVLPQGVDRDRLGLVFGLQERLGGIQVHGIQVGDRLVVLVERQGGQASFHHDGIRHASRVEQILGACCDLGRGDGPRTADVDLQIEISFLAMEPDFH